MERQYAQLSSSASFGKAARSCQLPDQTVNLRRPRQKHQDCSRPIHVTNVRDISASLQQGMIKSS